MVPGKTVSLVTILARSKYGVFGQKKPNNSGWGGCSVLKTWTAYQPLGDVGSSLDHMAKLLGTVWGLCG